MTRRTGVTIAVISGVVLLVAISAVVAILLLKPRSKLPETVRREVNYPVFAPAESTDVTFDTKELKYDTQTKQISYTAYDNKHGTKMVVSLQPTPESFTDIPQVYEKLTESMRAYSNFDSIQGKVYLTRPKELNGSQTAVMNSKGSLVFIRPEKDLSDDAWKDFFAHLEIIK